MKISEISQKRMRKKIKFLEEERRKSKIKAIDEAQKKLLSLLIIEMEKKSAEPVSWLKLIKIFSDIKEKITANHA